MNYWKQITFFTLFSCFAFSQSVNYKVIKDTPDDFANYWVNVGLLDVGFGLDNKGYGLLGGSINGVAHYKNKIGGEFTFRKYYLSLSEGNYMGSHFELGAFYHLGSKTKSTNQKVILSQKSDGKTTTTLSMKIPVTIQRAFGIRAGFNYVKEGLSATVKNHEVTSDVNLISSSGGLYAGLIMTTSVNARCHSKEYGIRGTDFVRRNYIDILFNPIRSVQDLNGSEYTGNIELGALGFRLGIEFLQAEPKRIHKSAVFQKFEIGSRPIDGYYVMYSIGFNFKRKVKSMSSFTVIREKE